MKDLTGYQVLPGIDVRQEMVDADYRVAVHMAQLGLDEPSTNYWDEAYEFECKVRAARMAIWERRRTGREDIDFTILDLCRLTSELIHLQVRLGRHNDGYIDACLSISRDILAVQSCIAQRISEEQT